MTRLSGLVLNVSHDQNSGLLPDISDLSARLKFLPEEGQVWLDDQRVTILNLESLATLRRELVESLGPPKAREILFRTGHVAGSREAELVMKVRAHQPRLDAFLVGPQLHALRGEVYVEPDIVEADIEKGRYYCEMLWQNSAEAEAHVHAFGGSSEPVCWMQLGYASGYTSAVMERQIVFKEVECVACGSLRCRIIGKPAEEWTEDGGLDIDVGAKLFSFDSQAGIGRSLGDKGIVGASPRFLGAWNLLGKVAPLNTTVLLLGETGVGKEIFAKALHSQSPRANKQMYSVNCAAIPDTLIDAELFGVEKGAFTGASQTRAGWFEVADGSTLFLDEIGTLSMTAQAKLLRVLQEGQFTRVGGTIIKRVDARIVCATNVDLEEEVRQGRFRADLLHRLNAFPIAIPPLRERRDDIPLLIQYFLAKFKEKTGKEISGFTLRAVDALLFHNFNGNVRELENMLERAAILTPDGEPIDTFHLFSNQTGLHRTYLSPASTGSLVANDITDGPAADAATVSSLTGRMTLSEIEAVAISEALRDTNGNVSKAARHLGLTRAQLRHRLASSKGA
ncbi:MAG: sigma 54-interacting transcriptional regulator [Brucella sp.]